MLERFLELYHSKICYLFIKSFEKLSVLVMSFYEFLLKSIMQFKRKWKTIGKFNRENFELKAKPLNSLKYSS